MSDDDQFCSFGRGALTVLESMRSLRISFGFRSDMRRAVTQFRLRFL